MNYNDEILENKPFNFIKQLFAYIAYAICAILIVALLASQFLGVKFGNIQSNSQAPYYYATDLVVIAPQKEYKVGDILEFSNGAFESVTHRLIGIVKDSSGVDHYICHGDNVKPANPYAGKDRVPWQEDRDYITKLVEEDGLTYEQIRQQNLLTDVQYKTLDEVGGIVIFSVSSLGGYISFIREHVGLFIAMVFGLWVVSTIVTNELELKKKWRLM